MNSTEHAIINSVAGNLEKSTKYDMKEGDLNEGYEFALIMKHTIQSNITVLRGLLSLPIENKETKDDIITT